MLCRSTRINGAITKEDSEEIKGFFAIGVLIHHLYQYSGVLQGTLFGFGLQSLGYLSVSIFFFLSGYGLSAAFSQKGKVYVDNFVINKIIPFYIKNIILIAIYLCFFYLINMPVDINIVISSFLFGKTVIVNGWYIQATILLYVIFYISFKGNKSKAWSYGLLVAGIVIFFLLCNCLGLSQTWYEAVVAFLIGVVYFEYVKKSKMKLCQRWKRCCVLLFLFLVSFVLGNIIDRNIRILFKMLSSIFFPLLIILIKQVIPYHFCGAKKICTISFEIYTIQGLFLVLYKQFSIHTEPILYIVLVVLSTILAAFFFHLLLENITDSWKVLVRKKKKIG